MELNSLLNSKLYALQTLLYLLLGLNHIWHQKTQFLFPGNYTLLLNFCFHLFIPATMFLTFTIRFDRKQREVAGRSLEQFCALITHWVFGHYHIKRNRQDFASICRVALSKILPLFPVFIKTNFTELWTTQCFWFTACLQPEHSRNHVLYWLLLHYGMNISKLKLFRI